jgi:dTDP-4-amino-4,6-dideoxygalactose transaminase
LALNGGPKAVTAPVGNALHWPIYGEEEEKAVVALLKNVNYGPIAEFEKAWLEFHKMPYCKAHCNGTSALTSMWFALDLLPGSEVLTPSYTPWFAIVPMRLFGLVPVWVDVNPRTMNMDVEDCKRRLTKNSKAIIPVHWFGLPCDMDHICDFAKEHGLEVVEDASHAHGASLQGRLMGTWGRMSGFSLQSTKPLPGIEGGMGMYTNRLDYERAVTYGNYDLPQTFPEDSPYRKYAGTALGSKLRIHPISALLAGIQLKHLVERNRAGAAQMKTLNDRLVQLPGLSTPYVRPDCERIYYGTNMLFLDPAKADMSRESCVKALQAEGVQATAYSWQLLHTQKMFHEKQWWHHLPAVPESLPGSDEANRTAISLPFFTSQTPELIDQYAKAFEKVWAHRKQLT